jgi:class 3 adenylate cyclase
MNVTQTAVFADLSDYTRVTEEFGDDAAARIAGVLRQISRGIAQRHRGEVVKMLGDGVHLQFAETADAVLASLELLECVESAGLPRAHIGVNAGPMVYAEGDYYGRAVNTAARITSQAAPGDVLVGEAVLACCATDRVRFDCLGPVTLKGIGQPVTLYRALLA